MVKNCSPVIMMPKMKRRNGPAVRANSSAVAPRWSRCQRLASLSRCGVPWPLSGELVVMGVASASNACRWR